MRFRAALPAALTLLLGSGAAHALESRGPSKTDATETKALHRSGFTIGTSGGFGFGSAEGYPNKIDMLGDPTYRSTTELGLGTGGAIWLGVAFNDYLTFGLGMGVLGLTGNDREANGGAFLFHIEAFPLFDVNKSLRDLGVFAHFGTGPLDITGAADPADGGLMAYVEGGVSYEAVRLWHFAFGPSVSVLHMWSESATLTGALVGGRLAFYSGP